MINYELAKQLEKAGFKKPDNPQGIQYGGPVYKVYIPSLSELIEACGECLSHIKRYPLEEKVYWWAVSHCGHPEHEPGGNNLEEQGSTPEEAVANLWLSLNK